MKRLLRKFRKEVKTPVLIPCLKGDYLKGKIVLITGGTRGIGFSIAEACLNNKAKVIITGRSIDRIEKAIDKLINKTQVSSNNIKGLELDICNIKMIQQKIYEAVNLFNEKRIDIFVNNAGVLMGDSIGKTSEEDYEKVLETNLKGTYFMSQNAADYMIKNNVKGNILNVSSASSIRPAISPYMVAKWGVNGLTEGLAKKYIKHGIVVNAIAPGPTATSMLLSDEDITRDESPSERFIMPEEIANVSVILISEIGRSIVGDTIYMTGGSGTLTLDDIVY